MTSVRLRAEGDYIRLLLSTTKEQGCMLLAAATTKQIEAICEIVLNLLTQILPKTIKAIVSRHKSLLEKLAKKRTAIRSKARLLKKHCKTILRILQSVRDLLIELLT